MPRPSKRSRIHKQQARDAKGRFGAKLQDDPMIDFSEDSSGDETDLDDEEKEALGNATQALLQFKWHADAGSDLRQPYTGMRYTKRGCLVSGLA